MLFADLKVLNLKKTSLLQYIQMSCTRHHCLDLSGQMKWEKAEIGNILELKQ